jgi:predicted N-acetyltransferase YhbS
MLGNAIRIRREAPSDLLAISEVNQEAFLGSTEATLVDALRAETSCISLVAQSGTVVVGHILFTPVRNSKVTRTAAGRERLADTTI